MNFSIKQFNELTNDELYGLLALRAEVFVVEQQCVYQDIDGIDQQSAHLLLTENDKVIGTLRIVPKGLIYNEIAIGRVCLDANFRLNGLGKELMQVALNHCFESNINSIRISAQAHLENFYAQLGFESTGKAYLEDGIPHIEMLLLKTN
jgi:ElaA protein